MIRARLWPTVAVLVLLTAADAAAQSVAIKASEASRFMGTWVFIMTNPEGSEQTVRIWEKNGVVSASLQIEKFPPNDVTGILKDGDVLVLTTTLLENGAPIWAVIALTLDGETMNMAQMLQRSQTIKRGTGHRQAQARDPSAIPWSPTLFTLGKSPSGKQSDGEANGLPNRDALISDIQLSKNVNKHPAEPFRIR